VCSVLIGYGGLWYVLVGSNASWLASGGGFGWLVVGSGGFRLVLVRSGGFWCCGLCGFFLVLVGLAASVVQVPECTRMHQHAPEAT
jgi:hypothetical protein